MKFVKGQSGNANGRPAGQLNKVNRLVKDVFSEVFNELQNDPETSLESWARENKRDFYNLVTKLIPVQLDHAGEVIQRIIIEDHESYTSIQKEPTGLPQGNGQSNS
jgi:hypothetical protein